MTIKSLSTSAKLSCDLISSYRVLKIIEKNSFGTPLDMNSIAEELYLTHQPWAARQADHIFSRALDALSIYREATDSSPLQSALRFIVKEFITSRHGLLRIKIQMFGVWQQSFLSRVSGIPFQAAANLWPQNEFYLREIELPDQLSDISSSDKLSSLLMPFDPLVEEYFIREGLNETHLHLNGSTHAELCWLRALEEPENETTEFCSKYNEVSRNSLSLRELARSIQPEFSTSLFRKQIYTAKKLRVYLINAAFGFLTDDAIIPKNCEDLYESSLEYEIPSITQNNLDYNKFISFDKRNLFTEKYWIFILLKRLDSKPSVSLTNMLHYYFILQNLYYRLLVQNEEQYGFDQFQKITWTDLRDPIEKDYLNRFLQMHGPLPNHSKVSYLEGRFAPKDSEAKNASILYNILCGYWEYLYKKKPDKNLTDLLKAFEKKIVTSDEKKGRYIKLTLVAHFVKQQETEADIPYRHYSLRKKLSVQFHALKNTINNYPSLNIWLKGIDAAANELDAPPEVFASVYRMCRSEGITHRTYHAGEDFHHILSGIRVMLDAIELLDLCEGDRIGHGTAMGISPELWLKRMPKGVYVRKDEWLLDLISTWRLMKMIGETGLAYKLESEVTEIGSNLFGENISSIVLERVMALRGISIEYLAKAYSNANEDVGGSINLKASEIVTPLNNSEMAEAKKVDHYLKANPGECKLLWRWVSDPDIRSRGSQLIFVNTDYLQTSEYIKLQQSLMHVIKNRKILIETLPSSNVRISYYESFDEHHVFRWMGLPGYSYPDDPQIMVTLGSDDPGIFSGDLSTEFYQLYAVMQSLGLNDKKSLKLISEINERGREYRFHDFRIG